MLRPLYIICSQLGVQDKDTGLLSLFNVLERLEVVVAGSQTIALSPRSKFLFPFKMVAVWMREPSDAGLGDTWESEIIARLGDNQEITLGKGEFGFPGRIQRVDMEGFLNPIPGFPSTGLVEVTCRVRPIGQQNWHSQTYPIIVDVLPSSQEGLATATPEVQDK